MNCKSKEYGTGYWYYPVLNLKHSKSNEKIPVKVAQHLADYHNNNKMARTRSVLVEVVPMYAMNTNREGRGIVPLILSQTPDYAAHRLVTIQAELSQFQVFSVCITLTVCLCVCHVLWTGWGRRAMWQDSNSSLGAVSAESWGLVGKLEALETEGVYFYFMEWETV